MLLSSRVTNVALSVGNLVGNGQFLRRSVWRTPSVVVGALRLMLPLTWLLWAGQPVRTSVTCPLVPGIWVRLT